MSCDIWRHAWKELRAHVRHAHEGEQVIALGIDNEDRPRVPTDPSWLGG